MTISKLKRLDDSGLWSPKVLSKWRLSVKASTPVSDGLIPQNKIHRRTLASFALENSIFLSLEQRRLSTLVLFSVRRTSIRRNSIWMI